MSTPKPITPLIVDSEDDTRLLPVVQLHREGYIPCSENKLRDLIRNGIYRCGWLGGVRVTTGQQHHRNVLRMTGRSGHSGDAR
jgi:hypothetical protein